MDSNSPILQERPDVNPYRHAAALILDRLKWDLHPASWISRARLQKLKDRHIGQKAIVVCNGPSLLKSDLSLLGNVFTFGLNKINLLFDKSKFRPSCIVAVNDLVIQQNADFYNQTNIPLFLSHRNTDKVKIRDNVTFLHSSHQTKVARDCSMSIVEGATVTVAALQLAYHMGFSRVGLIGCDHNFQNKGPANKTILSDQVDLNHFDPNYFANGQAWQLPDLDRSDFYYSLIFQIFSASNRIIKNCSVGGNLNIYPREELHTFIQASPNDH